MTYNEMDAYIYGGGYEQMSDRLAKLDRLDRIAWRIHAELHGRAQYDWWWDHIEPDIQDEIFEQIKYIVAEEIDGMSEE